MNDRERWSGVWTALIGSETLANSKASWRVGELKVLAAENQIALGQEHLIFQVLLIMFARKGGHDK